MGYAYKAHEKEQTMTLFKQISIIMSIFLLVVIASVMIIDFRSTTKYAQEELYSNAQNTTASLSLSLANAKGDVPTMSIMINAVFDSGYYKEIILSDREGNELYSRRKEAYESLVPEWFLNLYQLDIQSASAHVSSGWKPVGILEVTVLEESAYVKLYDSFTELIKTFIFISVITSALLYLLLRLLLNSLRKVKMQAEAVGKNNFILNEEIPYTTEFKEVTLSMNKMVSTVKHIFEQEAEAIKNYHKLLYTDPLSGFKNRKYFELKLRNLLHSDDINSKGVLLTIFFEGLVKANKVLGHDKVDTLIKNFSEMIIKTLSLHIQTIQARLDGTKFTIIFPSLCSNDIKNIADILLEKCMSEIQAKGLDNQEFCVKLSIIEYSGEDTFSGLTDKIEKTISQTQANSISISDTLNSTINIQDKKILIKDMLEKEKVSLKLQSVFDQEMKVYHNEAYVRLIDEEGEMIPAADFMPVIHQMSLDTQLDRQIITYAIKHTQQDHPNLALNISLSFIKDAQSLLWLKKTFRSFNQTLSFELSNHDLLTSIDAAITFAKSIQDSGHSFGIDRFTIDESNLHYLQALKPSYIKIDSHYLYDMLCNQSGVQNNALQIMTHSLGITIIATSIEDEELKDALVKTGITHFQGDLLSKPQML